MNLFIAAVILTYMLIAEISAPQEVGDLGLRLSGLLVVCFSVPGLALVQRMVLQRRYCRPATREVAPTPDELRAIISRMTACHSAVWMIASLLLVGSLGWHDIVRSHWNLDRWPLVDDILILSPALASLIVSWIIFYDVQRMLGNRVIDAKRQKLTGPEFIGFNTDGFDTSCTALKPTMRPGIRSTLAATIAFLTDHELWSFVLVRVRVYFLLLLIPLAMIVLLNDLNTLSLSDSVLAAIYIGAGVTLFLGFPFLLIQLWRLRPVENPTLREEMLAACREQKLGVYDVRVWKTGNQVANAMVAGFVPGFRIIIVTDGLLSRFEKHEVRAILRHEAAHIKLWHLPIRLFFVVLPLVAMAIAEQMGFDVAGRLNTLLVPALPGNWLPEWFGPSVLYGLYAVLAISWLSRKMELEADEFAARLDANVQQNAADLLDALMKFGALMPEKISKRSLMHPSISQRLERLTRLRDQPIAEKRTPTRTVLHGTFLTLTFVIGLMAILSR